MMETVEGLNLQLAVKQLKNSLCQPHNNGSIKYLL